MALSRFMTGLGLASCVVSVSLAGCASTGDLDALNARVATLESEHKGIGGRITGIENSLANVEARVTEVGAIATQAVERAAAAEREAAAAAGRADDAARRADAMFKKTVSK